VVRNRTNRMRAVSISGDLSLGQEVVIWDQEILVHDRFALFLGK
jgi:hypothetical protein